MRPDRDRDANAGRIFAASFAGAPGVTQQQFRFRNSLGEQNLLHLFQLRELLDIAGITIKPRIRRQPRLLRQFQRGVHGNAHAVFRRFADFPQRPPVIRPIFRVKIVDRRAVTPSRIRQMQQNRLLDRRKFAVEQGDLAAGLQQIAARLPKSAEIIEPIARTRERSFNRYRIIEAARLNSRNPLFKLNLHHTAERFFAE